jgi:hypothetical protein
MLAVCRAWERLGPHVGDHIHCGTVKKTHNAVRNTFAKSMHTIVDVFGTLSVHGILGHHTAGAVILEKWSCLSLRRVKL